MYNAAPPAAIPQSSSAAGRYETAAAAEDWDSGYYDVEEPLEEAIFFDEVPVTGGGELGGGMGGSSAVQPDASNRKIIYTADVDAQTKEFDESIALIEEMTIRYQGFIQSSWVKGKDISQTTGFHGPRNARFTLRIPENGMASFLEEIESCFNMTSKNIHTDDITGQYFDTKARLDSLRVQQEKLLEMLDKAEDVEYLLEVQKELARVGYEVESLTSALNRMSDAVTYSTINLYLDEVVEYEAPQTIHTPFSAKLQNAYTGSWKSFTVFCQDFVIGLVSITPFLVIVVPLLVLLVRFMGRRRKKRAALRQNQLPDLEEAEKDEPEEDSEQ